ncbi:MAG: hypothetical protein HC880_17890 [Bacteroidia bacterium]|nr:hypothetical protein [Bacteroidia bacterium]
MMTWAAHGFYFNYFHFSTGLVLCTAFFTLSGFYLASFSRSFNDFLVYTIGFLMVMGLPLLPYFKVLPSYPFMIVPTWAFLLLLKASFGEIAGWELVYGYLYLLVSVILSYRLALARYKKVGLRN